jgi:hypothetical protein
MFPARALAGKPLTFIRQGLSISSALLTISLAVLNAPTRDIGCSSSILGSDIECAEIAKLPYVFFKPPKRRRGKNRPSSDEGKRRRGPRIK